MLVLKSHQSSIASRKPKLSWKPSLHLIKTRLPSHGYTSICDAEAESTLPQYFGRSPPECDMLWGGLMFAYHPRGPLSTSFGKLDTFGIPLREQRWFVIYSFCVNLLLRLLGSISNLVLVSSDQPDSPSNIYDCYHPLSRRCAWRYWDFLVRGCQFVSMRFRCLVWTDYRLQLEPSCFTQTDRIATNSIERWEWYLRTRYRAMSLRRLFDERKGRDIYRLLRY